MLVSDDTFCLSFFFCFCDKVSPKKQLKDRGLFLFPVGAEHSWEGVAVEAGGSGHTAPAVGKQREAS